MIGLGAPCNHLSLSLNHMPSPSTMSTANQANSSRSSELRVYNSPYPAIAVPVDQSISQFLCTTNPDDIGPDKVILQDFDDDAQGITHQGLFTAAVNLSAVLSSKHRVTQGDVVCIFAENSVRWVVFAHSVLWGGGVVWQANSGSTPLLSTPLTSK